MLKEIQSNTGDQIKANKIKLNKLGNVYNKMMAEYHADILETHAFLRKLPLEYLDHLVTLFKFNNKTDMFQANTVPVDLFFVIKGKAEEHDENGHVIND